MHKNRWYHFIFPVVFLFLSTLILILGAMPGNKSSAQSKILTSLLDVGPETPTIVSPESLVIHGDPTLYVNHINTYTPIFTPENTTDQRIKIEVRNNQEEVQRKDCSLKGLKPGQVTLVFTSLANENLTYSLDINVLREPITSLTTTLTSEETVTKGMTSRLEVKANTLDFHLDDVEFFSSDNHVLTIDEQGFIYTHEVGKADVYVKAKNYDILSRPIELHVIEGTFIPVTMLTYPFEDVDIYVGEKQQVTPIFNQDASDKAFVIRSDDAKIDSHQVSFSKTGDYPLTITSVSNPTKSKTIIYHVKEVKASSITVSYSSIQYGKTTKLHYQLISEIKDLPVTNQDVIFESDNPGIATIDASGYVLGLKKGSVNISVIWKKDPQIKGVSTIAITSMESKKFDNLNHVIRKLIGHFGVFLITGVFGILTIYFFFFKGRKKYVSMTLIFLHGLLLAILSEVFQVFAGNRTPAWSDVGIDYFGYILGALLTIISVLLIHIKTKPEEKKEILSS